MFTVKHQTVDGTRFWETTTVYYGTPQATAPGVDVILFDSVDGHSIEITRGSVFIMNAGGKTVDQYHFGEPIAAADGIMRESRLGARLGSIAA